MTLGLIILFTLIGSIGSLIGSFFLFFKKQITEVFSNRLISFAAGTLIAAAFFDLLPEANQISGQSNIFIWALVGFISFFLAERYIRLFHFHHGHGEKPSTILVLVGDGVHNFIDGVTIAIAFLTNIPLGIATAIAVATHEIPQEIADMGVLLANGLPKTRALLFNFVSALTALFGALITYAAASIITDYIYIFLAVAAGHFIYISASDLIPEIHEEKTREKRFATTILFLIGVLTVFAFTKIAEG